MRSFNDVSTFGSHEPRGLISRILRLTRRERSNWLGRRLAFACRTLGILLLRGRPLDVVAYGARMRLYPAHNVSEKNLLFTPQLFDPDERRAIEDHLHDGFTFIDIGANVGGYSLFVAALAGPDARIVAIEPQPEIFERLVYNVRQNPFGTVKALECAVTDKNDVITLFVNPANSGESSVRFVNVRAGSMFVSVTTRTLQSIVVDEGFDRLDALKVDVEGAEDLILESFFRDADRRVWPHLLILDSSAGRPTLELPALAAGGVYREVLRTRSNVVYRRAPEQA